MSGKVGTERAYLILLRYIILLLIIFTIPLIYKIFFILTIYPVVYLLELFFQVSLNQDMILIYPDTLIQIIPACVAGSAYLLLIILNLAVPMDYKKRILSILFSFSILLVLNISRITILAILYHYNTPFFNFTHKLFWLFLSTVFVVAIWFLVVRIFSVKEIPVYSDMKYITGLIG
jgi:exosortase/archaeosortase family protein